MSHSKSFKFFLCIMFFFCRLFITYLHLHHFVLALSIITLILFHFLTKVYMVFSFKILQRSSLISANSSMSLVHYKVIFFYCSSHCISLNTAALYHHSCCLFLFFPGVATLLLPHICSHALKTLDMETLITKDTLSNVR